MAWQPEDLSSQVDGIVDTFTTTFQRDIGQIVLHHNGDRVATDQFEEPTSKTIRTLFTPSSGDTLHVVYLTDETVEGRAVGFSDDPTTGPDPSLPQSLTDLLDDLDNRVDATETQIGDLQDQIGQRFDYKESVQAASIADIGGTYDGTGGTSLRGEFTAMPNVVDGVTLKVAYRVLLKNQTAPAENGIWKVVTLGTGADGVWERADDFDQDAEVTQGARTLVAAGAVGGLSAWGVNTPDPIIIGGASGTALTWGIVDGVSGLVPADNGLFVGAPTSGDNAATGLTISNRPGGEVQVFVAGIRQEVGNGVKTKDCYFSSDGGTTARAWGGIDAGDELIWNGVVAGSDLQTSDRVDFDY